MSSLGPETFRGPDDKQGTAKKREPKGDKSREVVRARSRGLCEARTKVCTGRAAHIHHRLRRPHTGAGPDDPGLLLDTCWACHNYIHGHVKESYKAGWLIRSSTKGET